MQETFATDPVLGGRFVQQTLSTESQFIYNAAAQNLTAILDVDASPAYYLSNPTTPLTDGTDASFSARMRMDSFDDQQNPAVFLGLLTGQHVGDFGDGLVLVVSLSGGTLLANADIESFDRNYTGSGIPLDLHVEYLAVGRYRANLRQFAVELFTGAGFTNLVGFSTVSLPPDRTFKVDRIGLQNAGARDVDSAVGSITLTVDDLFGPAHNRRQIFISDSLVTEGDTGSTNTIFTVQLAPPSSLPISVNFATADGTALAGSDYIAQAGTLTFLPGITSLQIAVPVLGDLIHENAETFTVNLSNPVDASLAQSTGTGTILDNDPVPLLSMGDVAGFEGDTGTTPFEFLVTLSPASPDVVTVDFATSSGSATAGQDFLGSSGTVTFSPGQTTNRIVVSVVGDLVPEPDEAFFVTLSNPKNAALLKARGVGTIYDDDATGRLSINDVSVLEGNSGVTPAEFTVALTRKSSVPVSVDYAVASGTAKVGVDFTAASGTLTFPPGTVSSKLTIAVIGDTTPELDETFFVNLSNPVNATIAKATGLGTIRNDDPFPQLSIDDLSVIEGNTGSHLAVFPVHLSFPIDQAVTVSYSTADETATAPADYLAQSGTVTFAPGSTSQTISISIQGDTLNEPDETFLVTLSNPALATLGRSQAEGTILDDDPLPIISVADIALFEGNSGVTNALFDVTLSAPSGQPVSVSYTTADGTALAGSDYIAGFGTITFPPGMTHQPVRIAVNGDTIFEPDQTFTLQLSHPVQARLGVDHAVCTILNDDDAPQLSVSDVQVTEAIGGTNAVFIVTLSKPSMQAAVTVSYTTVDGTASAGLDYIAVSGVLTFAPGTLQTSVTVPVLDDTIHEADETFFLKLINPDYADLAKGQGTGLIHDNDSFPHLSIHDAQVLEGDSGTTQLNFAVDLDSATGLPVTATFVTSDGTATAASGDYVPASGQIRFEPGQTQTTLSVLIQGDLIPEPDETLFVDLSQVANALPGNLHAVGTILDDDTKKLAIADATVKEGAAGTTTNAIFIIHLNKASDQVVTVDYATADGTATANSDYFPTNGRVSFPPGTISQEVTVTVIGDNVFEPDETFFVNLTDPGNAILSRPQGVGTIVNDDEALAIVAQGMTVVSEDCHPANGAIDPGETVTVALALANIGTIPSGIVLGTLMPGPGVTPLNSAQTYGFLPPKSGPVGRTFTFRADGACGQALEAVLQIQNDGTNFGPVTFPFVLGTNVNGQPVCCNSADLALSATGTPDTVTSRQPVTYTVTVTNAGPKDATDVRLTNVWRAPVTVLSTTPSQGTCTVQGPSVNCALGSLRAGASATVVVSVAPSEVGALVAVFYGRAFENDPNLQNNTATVVTMVNPPPGISINDVAVQEGDSGLTNAVFTVRLAPPTGREVRVDYATSDGTALAGTDYLAAQGTLVFAPGSTSVSLPISVKGDQIIEPNKTFYVNLSNPINASLAVEQTLGTGTILDDDYPALTIDDADVVEPVAGGQATAQFNVRLSAPPQQPASVSFTTRDGTARATLDYSANAGQLVFSPEQTTASITVAVLADALVEADETFFVDLTNAVGLNLVRSQAKGTILDNNPSDLPQISITGASVREGNAHTQTNAVFNLSLSRASVLPVKVDFATVNGSALGGNDFVITSGQAQFAPGETNTAIAVTVNGDDTPELDETFLVRLSSPVGATLANDQATGTIVNDDYLPRLAANGMQLLAENCQPPNQAIDPLETVTVNFGLLNRGLGPSTNLTAALRTSDQILPLSNAQSYGAIPTNSPGVVRAFTFIVNGVCGGQYTAELELRDGGDLVGVVPFELSLGTVKNGQPVCCSSADLGVSVISSPEPVALSSPLTYQITVTNRGPSTATGLLLTNKLSGPVESISSSAAAQSCTNQQDQVVCSLADLPAGQSLTVTTTVIPAALGDLFNYILVGARENDPLPADNLVVAVSKVVPATGITINDLTVMEGNQDHLEQFAVGLWPPHTQTVTVDFNFQDGTASAGLDYVGTPGQLSFAPGVTNAMIHVLIRGDQLSEPDETFFALLSNSVNAPIARSKATGRILDDDPPALAINDVAVNVGTNGSAVAILTVSLSSLPKTTVQVDYSTSNGTANAGTDYEAQRGTLTFLPGVGALSIRIPIAGNTADEGEEQFFVQLANGQNATFARDRGTVTITAEAPVDLSITSASVDEGNSGFTPAVFSVTLRKPLQHTVTVDYFTSDGTATGGSDYVSINGTLVFPPGVTETKVSVQVIGDTIFEPDENFFLNLTNAVNGVIRNGRGLGTIFNDDPMPCVSIGNLSIAEGNSGTNYVHVPLHLSGVSSATSTVEVLVPDCRSSTPPDSIPQVVVFAPGQTEQFVSVPVVGDLVYEPDEACALLLTNAFQATICGGRGVLTVVNDDAPPGLEVNDVSVGEGDSGTTAARFTITLVGATTLPVTVEFATSDGTATAGLDYVAQSGMVTFTPGMITTNIVVLVKGDTLVEPDETFFVTLTQPTNASLFKAQGVGTIIDDDHAPQNDCPSLVVLATADGQTCFQPFSPIVLTAAQDRGADQILRVEFYSGSTLLGIDTSSPFEIDWEGAAVGDYCITAKAFCRSGRVITTEPTCLGVSDSGAAIAIVQAFDDPEIHRLREYLLEMGYCARVFDQAGLTFETLSSFQLVIWDDLGRDGLTSDTVQVLQQLFQSNVPLYLIGERFLPASSSLSPAAQLAWSNLLHLTALGSAGAPGTVTFSTVDRDRQPGSILSGRFGVIEDFGYTNAITLTHAAGGVTTLASAGQADLLVQFPDADTSDTGQARSVSQSFRVQTGGDDNSEADRKALFQNAVCWLLRCSFCQLINLDVEVSDVPATVQLGNEFTYLVTVSNNGECAASATIVTNQLPTGLSLVGVSYNQGIAADYHPQDRTLVWRVGSVMSGTENNAVISITVRAVQAGAFQGTSCAVANYERFDGSNCSTFDLAIQGTTAPQAPSLALLESAYGLFQLRLAGDQGATYHVETSSDLRSWISLTNAPGPLFVMQLPDASGPSAKPQFYRARWP